MEEWRDYVGQAEAARGLRIAGGFLKVRDGVWSPQLRNSRRILVYLPASYEAGDGRYPVVYMHDGQNLFDPATSFSGAWQVDQALAQLVPGGDEAIVVGVPNMGEHRLDEYSPFPDARLGGGDGDDYLAFIVETLKPLIDRDFRTLPGREHTGIVGSSMGGLISLYALFKLPQVFGFAGVMSPALWFARGAIFRYLDDAPFVPGRIWLDIGTEEGAGMVRNAQLLRDLLVRKGYRLDRNLRYREDEGAGHNEATWARRLPDVLDFLLRGPRPAELRAAPPPTIATAAD